MSDTPKSDDIYEDIVEGILGGGHNSGVEVMYEDLCEFETVLRGVLVALREDYLQYSTYSLLNAVKAAEEFLDSRVEP